MKTKKRLYRFFTIADYKEEEIFLKQQHQKGWKLIKMIPPCIFIFEECQKEEYVYQLDFPDIKYGDKEDYLQLFQDCGWEYVGECLNWSYFRKPVHLDTDLSIFSDKASKVDMIDRILKTRMLPLVLVFLGCVMPQLIKAITSVHKDIFDYCLFVFFISMFGLYMYLFLHCGLKLKQLKEELDDK